MPTHKSVREILNPLINLPTEFAPEKYIGRTCMICGFPFDKEVREKAVSEALVQLAELVREDKGNISAVINVHLSLHRSGYDHNPVSDEIAKAIVEHITQKLEQK
jgi:uncharacterized Fe-S cluster-containing MiaB family protein